MTRFHAIVPAGGSGTRLWPISRAAAPKFLVDLTGAGASLIEQTVARLQPLAGEHITVVCGQAHTEAIAAQVGEAVRIVAEPSPRNSMPAIALAAAIIAREDPDAVVGSFAADHLIADHDAFTHAVRTAIAAAGNGDLVTIGITPTGPATGYGYIQRGEALGQGVWRVDSFHEKPDRATAQSWFDAGTHLWNAGMFICQAAAFLDHTRRLHPELAAHLEAMAAAWGSDQQEAALAEHWPQTTKIAIDHALAEPLADEGRVAVVPADMGWADLGDADAVAAHTPLRDGVHLAGRGQPRVISRHSPDAYVHTDRSGLIAVLGIPGAVVVDTGDVLLVTTRERAQEVGEIAKSLGDEGLAGYQ